MKKDIMGLNIDNYSKTEFLNLLKETITNNDKKIIYTPNAEIAMMSIEDKSFALILNKADILLPDGQGVVISSKIIKNPLKEKVGGYSLIMSLLESGFTFNLFLLGSKPGIAEKAKEEIHSKYKNVTVVGTKDGYFTNNEDKSIISKINGSNCNVLLVGLGAPKQEYWIDSNKSNIKANIIIGVGGAIDVISGLGINTPNIFVKFHLEWFYRLIKQPKRFKRMLKIPKFFIYSFKKRFSS